MYSLWSRFIGKMLKKIFLLFSLLLIGQTSYSVEIPSIMQQTMAQDPIGMPGILNLVVSMAVVIALIYATGWIYTKLNVINKDKLKKFVSDKDLKNRFNVLQSMPLGQQRYLYSIEMNGKIMLIGSTPSHINLLKEFDKTDCSQEILQQSLKTSQQENSSKIEKKQELKSSLNLDEIYRKYRE